ncbi:MAG: ABC transporter substrate-binding protein [bacterium]|nr:ABC transporter substrate-binding protein [bacterium]
MNQKMYPTRSLLFAIMVAMLVIMAGCNGTAVEPTKAPADTISFQLSWIHEYSAASFYMAVENGHFAAQNLNVSIAVGGFGADGYIEPIAQVLSGESDFGTASSTGLIQAQAEGKKVVGIATILQRSPLALMSLKDSNIVVPTDLVGKTIMVSDGGARTLLITFLTQQGIDVESVTILPRTTFGVEPLINGETQVLAGWLINEGVMIEEAGFESNFMLLSDYGLDDYDFVIFTSQEMLDTQPQLVERFLRGYLAGLQDTIGNPTQAAKYVLKYDSTLNLDGQLARLEAMLPLINPPGTPLGLMDMRVWEQSQAILLEQQALAVPIDLTTIFTNDFIEKIYTAE